MVSIPQAPPIPNAPLSQGAVPQIPRSGNTINPFEKPAGTPNPLKTPGGVNVNPFKKASSALQGIKGNFAGKHKKLNAMAKYTAMTLFTILIVGYISLQAVMDENNAYLGIFGVRDNTASENLKLTEEQEELELETITLTAQNARIKQQIEEDNFFVHADTIKAIQEKQRHWSDTITQDGDPQFGLLDLPDHITQYFNEGNHDHEVLFSNGSNISIRNFTVERERTTFTIYAANFFGNVFLLSSEITKIINGLPEFKNGKILSYSRVKERTGNDAMSFTLTVDNQLRDEADPFDNNESSQKFQIWFEELKAPKESKPSEKKTNTNSEDSEESNS